MQLKDQQSYAGRATHISNMLFAWRPFLDPLWAAVSSRKPRGEDGQSEQKRSKAIKGTVWTKQVKSSLSWVSAFLRGGIGKLTRTWHVDFFSMRRLTSTSFWMLRRMGSVVSPMLTAFLRRSSTVTSPSMMNVFTSTR